MGYACPVCDTPQRDGEHLAHHLAFTAMLHGDDHESWLDDNVSDWGEREPAGLAAEVTPLADDAEYEEVFEDTVARGRPDVGMGSGAGHSGHDHGGAGHGHSRAGHEHGRDADPAPGVGVPDPESVDDPTVAEALREARELTREAVADDAEPDGDAGDDDDSAGDAADRGS